jgi:hypothetical protein
VTRHARNLVVRAAELSAAFGPRTTRGLDVASVAGRGARAEPATLATPHAPLADPAPGAPTPEASRSEAIDRPPRTDATEPTLPRGPRGADPDRSAPHREPSPPLAPTREMPPTREVASTPEVPPRTAEHRRTSDVHRRARPEPIRPRSNETPRSIETRVPSDPRSAPDALPASPGPAVNRPASRAPLLHAPPPEGAARSRERREIVAFGSPPSPKAEPGPVPITLRPRPEVPSPPRPIVRSVVAERTRIVPSVEVRIGRVEVRLATSPQQPRRSQVSGSAPRGSSGFQREALARVHLDRQWW